MTTSTPSVGFVGEDISYEMNETDRLYEEDEIDPDNPIKIEILNKTDNPIMVYLLGIRNSPEEDDPVMTLECKESAFYNTKDGACILVKNEQGRVLEGFTVSNLIGQTYSVQAGCLAMEEKQIAFRNKAKTLAAVYWCDLYDDGNKQKWHFDVPGGEQHNHYSFYGHTWIVRNKSSGEAIRVDTIREHNNMIMITTQNFRRKSMVLTPKDEDITVSKRPRTWIHITDDGVVFDGFWLHVTRVFEKMTYYKKDYKLKIKIVPLTPEEVQDMTDYLQLQDNEKDIFFLAKNLLETPVPANWESVYDDPEAEVWQNKLTGERTTVHPHDSLFNEMLAVQRAHTATLRQSGNDDPYSLYTWVDFLDENREIYFYNFVTGQTFYEIPDELFMKIVEVRQAAIMLQRLFRGFIGRRTSAYMKKKKRAMLERQMHYSILKLQSVFRGSHTRKITNSKLKEEAGAITTLQSLLRGYFVRREYRKINNEIAEVKRRIGFVGTHGNTMLDVRIHAAKMIQRQVRMRMQRNLANKELEEERIFHLLKDAATKIQARMRGLLARKLLGEGRKKRSKKKRNDKKNLDVLEPKKHKATPAKDFKAEAGEPLWCKSAGSRVINDSLCLKCRIGVLKKCHLCPLVWRVVSVFNQAKKLGLVKTMDVTKVRVFNHTRMLYFDLLDLFEEEDPKRRLNLAERPDLCSMLLNDLAYYFWKYDETDMAYQALQKGLALAEENRVHEVAIMSLMNIACVSNKLMRHEDSICYTKYAMNRLLMADRYGFLHTVSRHNSQITCNGGAFSRPYCSAHAIAAVCMHNITVELVAMQQYEAALDTATGALRAGLQTFKNPKDVWLLALIKIKGIAERRLDRHIHIDMNIAKKMHGTEYNVDHKDLKPSSAMRPPGASIGPSRLRKSMEAPPAYISPTAVLPPEKFPASHLFPTAQHPTTTREGVMSPRSEASSHRHCQTTFGEAKNQSRTFKASPSPKKLKALESKGSLVSAHSGTPSMLGIPPSKLGVTVPSESGSYRGEPGRKSPVTLPAIDKKQIKLPANFYDGPEGSIEHAELHISIVEAVGMAGQVQDSTFVTVIYGDIRQDTQVMHEGEAPVWFEDFRFDVCKEPGYERVIFLVWKRDGDQKSFLGRTSFSVGYLLNGKLFDRWLKLDKRDDLGLLVSSGELHVVLQMISKKF